MKVRYRVNINQLETWFLLIFMWFLFAFNIQIADRHIYTEVYYSLQDYSGVQEAAFIMLLQFFAYLGMPYQMFIMVLAFVEVLVLHKIIKNYTKYETQVLFLFLLFPFPYTVAQIRNTIAMLIVLYSCKYLIKEGFSWKCLVKYTIGVIIASLFHNTAIFFIVFTLIKFLNIKRLWCLILSVTGIGVVLSRTDLAVIFAKKFIKVDRYIWWLSNRTGAGFYVYLVITIGIFLVVHYGYIHLKKNQILNKKKMLELTAMYKINICLLLVIPLLSYGVLAWRVNRNMLPFSYLICVEAFKQGFHRKNKMIYLSLGMGYLLLLAAFMYCYTSQNFQMDLLRCNYIFRILY